MAVFWGEGGEEISRSGLLSLKGRLQPRKRKGGSANLPLLPFAIEKRRDVYLTLAEGGDERASERGHLRSLKGYVFSHLPAKGESGYETKQDARRLVRARRSTLLEVSLE